MALGGKSPRNVPPSSYSAPLHEGRGLWGRRLGGARGGCQGSDSHQLGPVEEDDGGDRAADPRMDEAS